MSSLTVDSTTKTMSSLTLDSKIRLVSSDHKVFEVDTAVLEESKKIKGLLDDISIYGEVPLPSVTSQILAKVIDYCKKHVEYKAKTGDISAAAAADEDLKNWDAEFVKAANYLNIKGLLDLTCQAVVNMVEGKTPEEIRKMFNIKGSFSPEEEEEIRRENQWAFE